jgi:hypothetical protein
MNYKLTFNQKPSYLHVVVTGRNSRENVERYFEELRSECVARACVRVLVEERLEGPRLEALEVFEIVSQGSGEARGNFKAFAHVDVNAVGDLMQFAEMVAVNRGVPVIVFPTVADAERWLLNQDDKGADSQSAADTDTPPR